MALKKASPCAMRMTNALDTGGGRHEEMYEKRGLRNSGTGICRGSTFAMTGCAGGEGEARGVAKYSGVQQLGEVPPHRQRQHLCGSWFGFKFNSAPPAGTGDIRVTRLHVPDCDSKNRVGLDSVTTITPTFYFELR
jgi:hypothetical protein